MPGSRDHGAEGCAAATHQNTSIFKVSFCDKSTRLLLKSFPMGKCQGHVTIVSRDVPLPPTKIPSVFKVSFQ